MDRLKYLSNSNFTTTTSFIMEHLSLPRLLQHTATNSPDSGLIFHTPESEKQDTKLTYANLLTNAQIYATSLVEVKGFHARSPVVLYLNSPSETLCWFWAALLADAIPVVLPQLSRIQDQAQKYVASINDLLGSPVWLTSSARSSELSVNQSINLILVDILTPQSAAERQIPPQMQEVHHEDDDAMFMLTSGSTGAPKAVRLKHSQVLTAVEGKLSMRNHCIGKPFLNWIGFDHVASIVEIHLTAMKLGVDQIHVLAVDMISNPLLFVHLMSRYQVTRAFAPNFFLAKVVQALGTISPGMERSLNFRCLTWLGSGGEANDVAVCTAITDFLSQYGAPRNVVVPGFGMTETCAGSIYHLDCPEYDQQTGSLYTSLGKCVPGLEMRIVEGSGDSNEGRLEVRGPVVFCGYYNNEIANNESFTSDGWFRTGDNGMLDSNGQLHLVGRAKESMIVNGVKHIPQDIENILQQTLAGSVSRVVCFSYRPPLSATESICVLYTLQRELQTIKTISTTHHAIVQKVMLHTSVRPMVISLKDEAQLHVSSLGKVSRNKMRESLKKGDFAIPQSLHEEMIRVQADKSSSLECDMATRALLHDFEAVLDLSVDHIGPDTPILEAGLNSIDIIRLKKQLDKRLGFEVPMTVLLENTTARSLAEALSALGQPRHYEPVITLSNKGTKQPLWLVHPGVGEIFAFLELTKYITDRPLFALRARGFDGQEYFESIEEAVTTYVSAIKKHQPQGPYAIAGYSYGAMLAFEVSKRLKDDHGDTVGFMGSFNLPPCIKERMRQLDWHSCLLHLCYFLELLTPEEAEELQPQITGKSQDEALDIVLNQVDRQRMEVLYLTKKSLRNWTQLSHQLHDKAVDYEPQGSVASIDVFAAEPLKAMRCDRTQWTQLHLARWSEHTSSDIRIHDVEGQHYTMLSREHAEGFSVTLKKALQFRGL